MRSKIFWVTWEWLRSFHRRYERTDMNFKGEITCIMLKVNSIETGVSQGSFRQGPSSATRELDYEFTEACVWWDDYLQIWAIPPSAANPPPPTLEIKKEWGPFVAVCEGSGSDCGPMPRETQEEVAGLCHARYRGYRVDMRDGKRPHGLESVLTAATTYGKAGEASKSGVVNSL